MLSKKNKKTSMPPPATPVTPAAPSMDLDAMLGLAGAFALPGNPVPSVEHSFDDSTLSHLGRGPAGSAFSPGGGLSPTAAAEQSINDLTMEDLLQFLNTPPTPVFNNTQQQTPLSQTSSSFDTTSPNTLDDDFARFLYTNELLTSPAVVSPSSPFQTSPALALIDDFSFNPYANQPLFFDSAMTVSSSSSPSMMPCTSTTTITKTINPNAFGLTGALSRENSLDGSEATSVSLSPQSMLRPIHTAQTTSPTAIARSSYSPASSSGTAPPPLPTGIRKNVKPADLLPVDAPIQARNYITPSATSRREIPPSVARTFVPSSSRKRSAASAGMDEMHDELADEEDAVEQAKKRKDREGMDPEKRALLEHVEASRRRNTLAARKSRQRKLEHVRGMEEVTERLQKENEALRARVEVLEKRLKDAGLDYSS